MNQPLWCSWVPHSTDSCVREAENGSCQCAVPGRRAEQLGGYTLWLTFPQVGNLNGRAVWRKRLGHPARGSVANECWGTTEARKCVKIP